MYVCLSILSRVCISVCNAHVHIQTCNPTKIIQPMNVSWTSTLQGGKTLFLFLKGLGFRVLKSFFRFLPRCMECSRGIAMGILSVCLSVRPSVRLFVCQTRALWQDGRTICPDFYTVRKIIQSSFMRRRMVGGGRPLLPEILGQPARVGNKLPILNR